MPENTPNQNSDFKGDIAFDAILNSPASSYWLKEIITSGRDRDPVDVIHDLRAALFAFEDSFDSHFGPVREWQNDFQEPLILPLSIAFFAVSIITLLGSMNYDRYEPFIGYLAAMSFVFLLTSGAWTFFSHRQTRA